MILSDKMQKAHSDLNEMGGERPKKYKSKTTALSSVAVWELKGAVLSSTPECAFCIL